MDPSYRDLLKGQEQTHLEKSDRKSGLEDTRERVEVAEPGVEEKNNLHCHCQHATRVKV